MALIYAVYCVASFVNHQIALSSDAIRTFCSVGLSLECMYGVWGRAPEKTGENGRAHIMYFSCMAIEKEPWEKYGCDRIYRKLGESVTRISHLRSLTSTSTFKDLFCHGHHTRKLGLQEHIADQYEGYVFGRTHYAKAYLF